MFTRQLTDQWDMTFGRGKGDFLSGIQAIKQKIKMKLQLLHKEWFLDLDAGFPWEKLAQKPFDRSALEGFLKIQILQIPGVEALTSFEVNSISTSRHRHLSLKISLRLAQETHQLTVVLGEE